MLPIVLIHGYSSEGADNTVEEIYGTLPGHLRERYGDASVVEIDLARWISLNDAIALDDISFAMERALRSRDFSGLKESGFHAVTHSTGSLVVRNWLRLFPDKPAPLQNLVHLAGANFGSGLAHVGRGRLARWARLLQGVGAGMRVLDELELGSSKTLDLHLHFTQPGHDMFDDYGVQEFGIIGSQTLAALRVVPIRYVKEDSADNTVRTAASNLNFNHVRIEPHVDPTALSAQSVRDVREDRLEGRKLSAAHYHADLTGVAISRRPIPFTVVYETAHFGGKIGIVSGSDNRNAVLPHLFRALDTDADPNAYAAAAVAFDRNTGATLNRIAKRKSILAWDRHAQYEAHCQVVIRLRDQYGDDVGHHDILFRSPPRGAGENALEEMIEDVHANKLNPGTTTFYLRTRKYEDGAYRDLLADCKSVSIEITGSEPGSSDIGYVPLTIELERADVPAVLQSFRTTVVDVTLLRVPSPDVFSLQRHEG